MRALPLFSEDYVLNRYLEEFQQFRDGGGDEGVASLLAEWDARDSKLTEVKLESGLLHRFFRELWGYHGSGEGEGYTLSPKYVVEGASAKGNSGIADVALGYFGASRLGVPQAVVEFKDVRSGLDSPQRRKGNPRTPVKQMFDYLRCAFAQCDHRSPVVPSWGIVTDMNEFRLYHRRSGESQFQRFMIRTRTGDDVVSLLDDSEAGAAQRFLFSLMFHRNMLIAEGEPSMLERILEQQWVHEKDLERDFYGHYSKFRERLYAEIVRENPKRTKVSLLRVTQRLIDRFIFLLFCEDMGDVLRFPRDLVRDLLVRASTDPYFDEGGDDIWRRLRRLFGAMEQGGRFAEVVIPAFNGGLFREDPEIDDLVVPNRVFCEKQQGASQDALQSFGANLLYLSASYNFGEKGIPRRRTIGLYTLGHIFEQSITDLEMMEAHAEGREALAEPTRRKRDGVYYTPEWVTSHVVEETVGRRMQEIRLEIGMPDPSEITEAEIEKWHARSKSAPKVGVYLRALELYAARVEELRILDPACGSGAFLIQALRRLLQERRWIAGERERLERGARSVFDADEAIRSTLANNIYGVDINSESVEITKLALWLHTAQPGRPLAVLDSNVRVGNSLVDGSFKQYFSDTQTALFDDVSEQRRVRVAIFDWEQAFSDVMTKGFDCVIGNPPYVKYQHFYRVDESVAEYLRNARNGNGNPVYVTTGSGNFDLSLPFIEKGLRLLAPGGRMGYIAPSVWAKQVYGEPLRNLVRENRSLERWLDFGDFQVFEDVTTYTALQFFTQRPCAAIDARSVRGPALAELDWDADKHEIPYDTLPKQGAWNLLGGEAGRLLARLEAAGTPLAEHVESISVGVQTSADDLYHFHELAPGRYESKGGGVVELESTLVRPLVSGTDVHRWTRPRTTRRILFPYQATADGVVLVPAAVLRRDYPKTWEYLCTHESRLRGRERGKFDDDQWYRFGRNQNIDKQHLAKLLVPRLVQHLAATPDLDGAFVADNVDVGYVISVSQEQAWFVLAILNSTIADWWFRHTSKPFRGDYRSANRQYLAPLPVPAASEPARALVVTASRALHGAHEKRAAALDELDALLAGSQARVTSLDPSWVWADLEDAEVYAESAPVSVKGARARLAYGRRRHAAEVAARVAGWGLIEEPVTVEQQGAKLRIVARGRVVQDWLAVEARSAAFLAAQWRHALRRGPASPDRLLEVILQRIDTRSPALRKQVIGLDARVRELEGAIAAAELALDQRVADLYGLDAESLAFMQSG